MPKYNTTLKIAHPELMRVLAEDLKEVEAKLHKHPNDLLLLIQKVEIKAKINALTSKDPSQSALVDSPSATTTNAAQSLMNRSFIHNALTEKNKELDKLNAQTHTLNSKQMTTSAMKC